MSAEDLQQEEKKERASLDKISENEAVEVLLDTFDYWVNEYAMHLKVGIIKSLSINRHDLVQSDHRCC